MLKNNSRNQNKNLAKRKNTSIFPLSRMFFPEICTILQSGRHFTIVSDIILSMSMQATNLSKEQQAHDFLAQGETEKGKQFLVAMITERARQRKFDEADKLHKLLMDCFPMALPEIIRTAEIIENEKTAAIGKSQLAVWSSLLKVIDLHEFIALYHCMEHRRFAQGEMIVKQGSQNSDLYFIHSGRVELFFKEKGAKIPLKTMGAGEILGAGTFFEASVWTINALSMGTEVSALKVEAIQQLQKDFPGIDSKLNDFCARFTVSPASFGITGRERRMYARSRISGVVKMILFDKEGKDSGVAAKGDLFDISAGGVSFFLRISKKNNARLLLGRAVGLTIASVPGSRFNIGGVVKAVRSQPIVGNEYAVSVQFGRELAQKELKNLILTARENTEHP